MSSMDGNRSAMIEVVLLRVFPACMKEVRVSSKPLWKVAIELDVTLNTLAPGGLLEFLVGLPQGSNRLSPDYAIVFLYCKYVLLMSFFSCREDETNLIPFPSQVPCNCAGWLMSLTFVDPFGSGVFIDRCQRELDTSHPRSVKVS